MMSAKKLSFIPSQEELTQQIFSHLMTLSNFSQSQKFSWNSNKTFQKIYECVLHHVPLNFILPAFPAKSPNPNKTVGHLPDLGEFIGLQTLNQLCQKISSFYSPGAEVWICSDGRVFNDLVLVSDQKLSSYKKEIQNMITEFDFKHLKTFDLDNCFESDDFDFLRAKLVEIHGQDLKELNRLVKTDPNTNNLFNGLHRFIKEDQSHIHIENGLSKNQINKLTKQVAYKVIQRSNAWSQLLEQRFPEGIRLSIHPYPSGHQKFGIKLVQSSDLWATPWHNVTIKLNGRFQLIKKQQVDQFNAKLKFFRGQYAYFEA